MPFNGSGGFVPVAAPNWPATAGQPIYASQFNTVLQDVFAGLSQTLTRDGQGGPAGNLNMAGFHHTNASGAQANGQYLVYGQTDDAKLAGALLIASATNPTASKLVVTGGSHLHGDGNLVAVYTNPSTAFRQLGSGGPMYFDVGSEGAAGNFVFRSSSSFTTVATLSHGSLQIPQGGYFYTNVAQLSSSSASIFSGGVTTDNVGGLRKTSVDPAHFISIQVFDGITFHAGVAGIAGASVSRTAGEHARLTPAGMFGLGTVPAHYFHVNKDTTGHVAKIQNSNATLAGHGLWVDTRWNVPGNIVARFSTNSGSTEVLNLYGDQSAEFGGKVKVPNARIEASGASALNMTINGLSLGSSGGLPYLAFVYADGAADQKLWDFYADNSTFNGRLLNDVISSASSWLQVTRIGVNVDTVSFPNGSVATGGTLSVGGSLTVAADAAIAGDLSFSGSLTGLTSSHVTTALGFTPYSNANPSGFISGITGPMVTTALGFTPYSTANPSGFITGITGPMVTTALGFTPISGITGPMVTTALGYTPYNSTNPANFITSSALAPYAPLAGPALTGTPTVNGGILQRAEGALYTPVFTIGVNTTAGTPAQFYWTRHGNVVTVTGSVDLTITVANTLSSFALSLPVATAATVLWGVVTTKGGNPATMDSGLMQMGAGVANAFFKVGAIPFNAAYVMFSYEVI